MNPFRYHAYDVSSRTYLGRLPYQGVTFGVPQKNTPGPFTGSIPLADPRVQRLNWPAQVGTGKTALIVEMGGQILWGGMLWTSNYNDSDPTKSLQVGGSTFGSYAQQRVQAEDYSTTFSAGADPMLIAEQIFSDAMALGTIMGGITIVLHPSGGEGGPVITPTYPKTASQTIDQMVSMMAQMGYDVGFDYSFDVTYVSGLPAVTLNIWFPRAGRAAADSHLVILQRNVIDFTYPIDSTRQATDVTETGAAGVGAATASFATPGYPRLERVFSRVQITDPVTLANVAAGDIYQSAWPVITPTVTLPLVFNPDPIPETVPVLGIARQGWRLTDFAQNDNTLWKIDPMAGGGNNTTPRFPAGMSFEWQINGWTAMVADQAGQVSTILLNLGIPVAAGDPPEPPL